MSSLPPSLLSAALLASSSSSSGAPLPPKRNAIDARTIAVELNNYAVDLLEQGEYEKANSIFRSALNEMIQLNSTYRELEMALRREAKSQNYHHRHHQQQQQQQHNTGNTSDILRMEQEHLQQEEQELEQVSPTSFLYCHAFRIVQIAQPQNDNSACYIRDAAVIMYNMALVKHLQHMSITGSHTNKATTAKGALCHGEHDSQEQKQNLLAKSLNLYRLVNVIVTSDMNSRLVADDPYFRLVLMATCNNMASIYHSTYQFRDASFCLQSLAVLLTHTHLSNSTTFMDQNALHGFHMNLMLLAEPPAAPAA
mmetsp:Transcript_25645/g.36520  ORF Transcript_25645/g.36520 Transcript_25645/m.36520 type:complete len:310 (+) Transcript_25645:83-1012(+)